MNRIAQGNLTKIVGIFESLLKIALLVSVFVLWPLYVFAIPLGLELFFFGNLSTTYSPSFPISMTFLFVRAEVSLGLAFVSLLLIYILCFILAWKQRNGFHQVISGFSSKQVDLSLKNFLSAMPVLSSLTYVVVVSIHFFEESHGIPVGEPPVPTDPLLAFFQLTASPLMEEIIFRILPTGVFLIVSLLTLQRKRTSAMVWQERLKFSLLCIISPENAKKRLGLKTVEDSGFSAGIRFDEWVMVLFTAALFGFSHYFFTSTWNVGKIASAFVQGLVMGLSYLVYGIHAPILIHWYFNYYFYAYGLAAIVHPNLAILNSLNQRLTSVLGVLGLLIMISLGVRLLSKSTVSISRMHLYLARKLRYELRAQACKFIVSLRESGLSFFRHMTYDLATLILVLAIFAIRLAIVNFPKPEVGRTYYDTGFVFDESYYVKAARKLLNGEPSNNEHPPLSKVLIVLGIVLFGDNPLGWRISSIIMSSISIALLYELALLLSRNKAACFSAALLFATDIMAFDIGQIGMLDASSIMFVLIASILLLRKRYDLSGLFFGLAFLCKLSSIFAVGIIFFLLWIGPIEGKKSLVRYLKEWAPLAGRILLIGFITLLIGLWIYDAGYKVFNGNPVNHLNFMFIYNNSLKYEDAGDVILPLQWINPLNPFSPVPYHVTTVREIPTGGIVREYHPIAYYGLYTPLWWSIWAIGPISLIQTIRKAHKSEGQGIDAFVFLWIVTNFFPYIMFAYLIQRWVYPFYFCMTLPGLYMGLPRYLSCSRLSKVLLILSILIQLFWFFLWFPVKPKIIIDFLSLLGLPI